MPTAGKLIASVGFALVGWFTSYIIALHALPGSDAAFGAHIGWFKEINAVLAFFLGWRIIGVGLGETIWLSSMQGVFAAIALLILGLFFQGFYAMIIESLESTYRSPEAAFEAMTNFIAQFFILSLKPIVYGTLFGGAILTAMLAHGANGTWR